MANKKDRTAKEQEKKEPHPEKSGDGGLTAAASAIGSVLGTVAAKTGIEMLRPADLRANKPSTKKAKLAKKNKPKLPRRQKKAAKKAAAGIH